MNNILSVSYYLLKKNRANTMYRVDVSIVRKNPELQFYRFPGRLWKEKRRNIDCGRT